MESLATHPYHVISNHIIAEVRRKSTNGQNSLFVLHSYQPGDRLTTFSAGTISAEPTYLTIQLGTRKHVTFDPEYLQYINHSCDPNVFIDTSAMEVIALKPLKPGDELSFFYPATEWKMIQRFHCYCGSPFCLGEIKGAAFLSKEVLEKYRLTDFIQHQLAKRAARKVA